MADRDAELLAAAREGDIGRVARWLRLGARVNAVGRDGSSPVTAAALEGHLWVVNKLLDAGADLALAASRGRTALLSAALGGHVRVVQKLLDAGAGVNARDLQGDTALILSAANGHAGVVRLLLQKGADPDVVNARGETALAVAQANGHASVAQALGEVTESPQQFFRAVAYGNADGVRRGVDRYLHTRGSRSCSPVLVAAQHGQFEVLKLLVFRGANVGDRDESGWTALHFAAQSGNAGAVAFLLAQRANASAMDEHGVLPVAVAAMYGHVDIVRELCTHSGGQELIANVGRLDKRTVLHHAAASASPGASATLEYLLANVSSTVDIDAGDANGWTALHLATQSGSALLVDLLLTRGANMNLLTAFDCSGPPDPPLRVPRTDTALHLAVQHAHLGIVRLLLGHNGVDPDIVNHDNQTPLLQAVLSGQNEIAIALIDGGANPDAGDDDGRTPLLVASRAGSHELVKALLQHGARVDVMSKFGETPIKKAPSEDIRAILQVYQASQRFHSRCVALLKAQEPANVSDLVKLVPLITSVYDLRLLLTVALTITQANGPEDQRAATPVVADLLKTAFTHVLTQKLVLDDDACVFFRLVLEHCVDAKLVTPSEFIRWKVQASKVNMESAEWVVELKKQVHQNSRRLGLHDQSIRMVAEGMRDMHALAMENRAAVADVKSQVEQLQEQVETGKKLLAGLMKHTHKLTDRMEQFQERLNTSESHIVAVASGLQSFRSAYVTRLQQEKKQKMIKMGCGLVASLVGFAFAPVLKDVFDSVIDLTNPIEVYNHVFSESDVVSFLADQATENVLQPAVEAQLEKYAISREQFETSLRQEIVERHPELVDECEKRGLAVALDGGDADDVRALTPELKTAERMLEQTLTELQTAAKALSSSEVSVTGDTDKRAVGAAFSPALVRRSSLRALPNSQTGDLSTTFEGLSSTASASAQTQPRLDLSGSSSQELASPSVMNQASGGESVVFIDDLHDFPYHFAVQSSGGELDEFLELTDVIDSAQDDPNAVMKLALTKKTSSEVVICAAEYAYLLGYRVVGDLLASRMKYQPQSIDPSVTAVSVTLLQDVNDFPFVFAVQESRDDVEELELLTEVIDEEQDPVDATVKAEVVYEDMAQEVAWSAVELACHLGYVDIVKYLLVKKRVATVMKSVVVLQRARARARARLGANAA